MKRLNHKSRFDPSHLQALRLPRRVEDDPRRQQILRILTTHTRPLWHQGEIEVPVVTLSPELAETLRNAHKEGQVVRSLENAERRLAAEERGLDLVDRNSGLPRGGRVSRLLVLAGDGAERFYRHVERLLHRHGPRVLAVHMSVDGDALGELLFGPGSHARLLMLDHKAAVSSFLLALTKPSCAKPSCEEEGAGSEK
ncbi:MAG: hypothetical protein HQ561_10745 [Desulfobacteraceae bacterium]|nr:hypothetical protein [Desulfobacteraceae bacterium]